MRTTTVPAQVTTVEDKIAGNITFTQLLLLVTPVFISGVIFAFLPPFMDISPYKLVMCIALAVICITLSIRIKGKLLLNWIIIVSGYYRRPGIYLLDKNDPYLREIVSKPVLEELVTSPIPVSSDDTHHKIVPLPKLIQLESVLADGRSQFHFTTTRKGELRVHIKEIK